MKKEVEYFTMKSMPELEIKEFVSVLITSILDERTDLDSVKNSLLTLTFVYNQHSLESSKDFKLLIEDAKIIRLFTNLTKILPSSYKINEKNGACVIFLSLLKFVYIFFISL